MNQSEVAAVLILAGGVFQVLGVVGVVVEVRNIRSRVKAYRTRPVVIDAQGMTVASVIDTPKISGGGPSPTIAERVEQLEATVEALPKAARQLVERELRPVRKAIEEGDRQVAKQIHTEISDLAALVIDLQPVEGETSSVRIWLPPGLIVAGVVAATIGSYLAISPAPSP